MFISRTELFGVPMLVSIITVNFNQPQVTEELLNSLRSINTYHHIEVIVVDNGSDINVLPKWIKQYPEYLFIRSEVNTGFAGGNNIGYDHAKGALLFFINNDTEVTATLLEGMVTYMHQNPNVGIVSPKILYFDQPKILQYAGFTAMNYLTARNQAIGQFEVDNGQYQSVTGKTGYIHGAAMMVTRKAIDTVGLMAENFFLYYEELDWCERIRNAGFEIHVNMEEVIYHKESISVGKNSALKEYFMNRNRILFIRKNTSWFNYMLFCCYFLFLVVPRNIFKYLKNGDYDFIPVLFKAIIWHLYNKTSSKYLGFPQKFKK